jgi:hypothetical protein
MIHLIMFFVGVTVLYTGMFILAKTFKANVTIDNFLWIPISYSLGYVILKVLGV